MNEWDESNVETQAILDSESGEDENEQYIFIEFQNKLPKHFFIDSLEIKLSPIM